MPTLYVTRKVSFNAAHRLHNPTKSDEWNRTTYGKCNSPNWHGHNYVLEVTVAGEPDPDTGYVVDLGRLKEIVAHRSFVDSGIFQPGFAIHELGGARMGRDAGSGVLDPSCRCWDAENVLVTDGACFVSSAYQNPTLSIMALTVRAAERAIADFETIAA